MYVLVRQFPNAAPSVSMYPSVESAVDAMCRLYSDLKGLDLGSKWRMHISSIVYKMDGWDAGPPVAWMDDSNRFRMEDI